MQFVPQVKFLTEFSGTEHMPKNKENRAPFFFHPEVVKEE
jgi:hypothetical protein